jgi:hypothetical protein
MAAWHVGVSGERGAASRRVCHAGVGERGRIETNQDCKKVDKSYWNHWMTDGVHLKIEV